MGMLILLTGVFVSMLLAAGLILTVHEFRRSEQQGYHPNPNFPL